MPLSGFGVKMGAFCGGPIRERGMGKDPRCLAAQDKRGCRLINDVDRSLSPQALREGRALKLTGPRRRRSRSSVAARRRDQKGGVAALVVVTVGAPAAADWVAVIARLAGDRFDNRDAAGLVRSAVGTASVASCVVGPSHASPMAASVPPSPQVFLETSASDDSGRVRPEHGSKVGGLGFHGSELWFDPPGLGAVQIEERDAAEESCSSDG